MGQSSVYLYYSPVSDPTLGGPVTVLGGAQYRTRHQPELVRFQRQRQCGGNLDPFFNSQTSAVFSGYLDSAGEPIVSQFYSGVTPLFPVDQLELDFPVRSQRQQRPSAVSLQAGRRSIAGERSRLRICARARRVLTASRDEAVVRWVGRRKSRRIPDWLPPARRQPGADRGRRVRRPSPRAGTCSCRPNTPFSSRGAARSRCAA